MDNVVIISEKLEGLNRRACEIITEICLIYDVPSDTLFEIYDLGMDVGIQTERERFKNLNEEN